MRKKDRPAKPTEAAGTATPFRQRPGPSGDTASTKMDSSDSEVPSQISQEPEEQRSVRELLPYGLVSVAGIYLIAVLGFPFLNGLWLSFTDTSIVAPRAGEWIGLDNYQRLVGSDRLWQTLQVTLIYTVGTVIGAVGLGLASAVAMNSYFPGRTLARALIATPWATPVVAAALIFSWMLDNRYGVFSWLASSLGMQPPGWLTSPDAAMWSILLATVWKIFPLATLVLLAALQSVSGEQREAAVLDGADALNVFKNVTLPSIRPTLAILILLITIWSFRRFEIIWLLTQGGPVGATNTLVIDVYREAFRNRNLGLAGALGVIGLLLSVLVTSVFFVIQNRASAATRTSE